MNYTKYIGRIFIYILHYFSISTINLQIIYIQHLFSKNLFFPLSYSIIVACLHSDISYSRNSILIGINWLDTKRVLHSPVVAMFTQTAQ